MTEATTQHDAELFSVDRAVLETIFAKVALICASAAQVRAGLQAGHFNAGFYSMRGQEIIPAAAVPALRPDDYMVTTYRCLHDVIAKGTPLTEVMAEMLGRVTGTSKGKGGPMHLSDPNSGLMVTTGIVGGGVPIANGLALAAKMLGTGQVTIVSFGDGATSIGAVHEAFNLATLWDLPVIFLLQNNQYGEHTEVSGYTKTTRLSDRAAGYGMRGVTVDGNDPVQVFRAVRDAADRARSGEGPTLLECLTYRLEGHSFGATTTYMDQQALKAAWDADPVPRFRERLLASGLFSEEELAKIEADADAQATDAMKLAMASEFPELSELYRDVFADERDVLV